MSDAPQAPPPPSAGGAKEAKAHAKAAKAHAKALRPWYKKKRIVIPLILLLLVIGGVAASGGGSEDESNTVADGSDSGSQQESRDGDPEQRSGGEQEAEEPADLYPDRPDRQKEDQEVALGDSVELSGYTAWVNSATHTQEEFTSTDLITINVKIENRDDSAQPYNTFDWKIQNANGQVLDPTFLGDNDLGSGDLVGGGTVEGTVTFEGGPGTYYIIYKPDPFDAARGIWQITV